MSLVPESCLAVDGEDRKLPAGCKVNACAAIGYPQRFFDTLQKQQFTLNKSISFADHHAFTVDDFKQFDEQLPLLMTEKDAVKCTAFAQANWWYLPISAQLPNSFEKQLIKKIKEIK
jgi:tetraacyldisaccharide 4'-kinase